jgi:hypothetical protein
MNVTPQQQREAMEGRAVPLHDPETHADFVLIRADLYDRVRGLVVEELDPSFGYDAFRQAAGEEWDDPALDVYEQYRKRA